MIRYDPERKTVFSPTDLRLKDGPRKCLLIFDDEIWEDFVLANSSLETSEVTNISGRVFSSYRYLEVGQEKILLVCPSWGAAASVCDAELLIASGIERIVAFGTCGRLDEKMAKNTIILPTAAFREEGVSYHYLPDKDEIGVNERVLKIAETVFQESGLATQKGKIWTTDAVYRETLDKVALMRARGCVGVDMELSALLALAQYRGVVFFGFLIGDDAVGNNNTEPLARRNEKIFDAAAEILNKI